MQVILAIVQAPNSTRGGGGGGGGIKHVYSTLTNLWKFFCGSPMICERSHEPEILGINRILTQLSFQDP